MNARVLLLAGLLIGALSLSSTSALAQNRTGGSPVHAVFALELGGMSTELERLDSEFHQPNGALPFGRTAAATLNGAAMLQVGSVLRIGGVLGFSGIGSEYTTRQMEFVRAGARLELGYGTKGGWGFWLGAEYFYGRALTTSRDNAWQYDGVAGFYDYEARGSGMRFAANIDVPLFWGMKLRISPFIEHFAANDEVYTVNISDRAPEPVLPAPEEGPVMRGMGLSVGAVLIF